MQLATAIFAIIGIALIAGSVVARANGDNEFSERLKEWALPCIIGGALTVAIGNGLGI